MNNSEHIENCPCAWCEVERQNADMRAEKEPPSDTPEGEHGSATVILRIRIHNVIDRDSANARNLLLG